MKNCKLIITFATINPNRTWTPRTHTVEVGWIYAQNEVQIKETAQKFARDNEIVFKVKKEEGGPEILFKAVKDFSVTFETYYGTDYDLVEQEEFFYEKGYKFNYSEHVRSDIFGFIIENSMVSLEKERCGETCYYPAFVPLENFSAFYYDGDNEVEIPDYLSLIEQKKDRENS